MTTELAMRRVGNRLAAIDPVSEDELATVPQDKDLLVTIKTPRNVKQFKLAWCLAKKVSEAVDFLHDSEDAMNWLKIKARHVRILQDPKSGQIAIVPKSIAFASLSQDNFAKVFNRMIYVTCTEIIPGLDEGSLRSEIEAMVSGERKT